jgi:hypothetical protein
MFAIPSFSITPSTLRDLLNFAAASGNPDRAAEFADQAIREWLACACEPAHATCRADSTGRSPPTRGYQWKSLFLPEGTQLRVWSRENGSRYAEVVGDLILHAGHPITPNQFVRLQKGIPRNAWMEVFLLMPGETAWKPAHVRRDELRRAEHALRNPASPAAPSAAPPAPSALPVRPALSAPAAACAPPPPPRAEAHAHLSGSRLPRVPPIDTQARMLAAQGPITHWWPGGPERRVNARRAEDAFLD